MILFVFCKCELHKKFQLVSLLSWHSKGGAIGRQSPLAGIAHLLLKAGATIYCGSGGGSWPHPCVLSGACMWHKFTHRHTHTQSTPAHTFTHSHSGLSSVHCAHAVRQTFSQLLNQCEIVLIQKGHSTHSLQQLEPATPSGSASDCDSDSDSDSAELMPCCPGALVSC